MNLELVGKRAVVTGSTAGIGFATALGLAREGASVVVNGRTQARVDEAMRQITDSVADADLLGAAADLGTAEGVQALLAQVPEADILVNNVGIFEPKAFAEIDDAD